MAKTVLELRKKDKDNKQKTVGSIEIKNQTEQSADLYFYGDINSESLGSGKSITQKIKHLKTCRTS